MYDDYYDDSWALSEEISDLKEQNDNLRDVIAKIVDGQSLSQLESLIKMVPALGTLLEQKIEEDKKRIKDLLPCIKTCASIIIKSEKELKSLQNELAIAEFNGIKINSARKNKIDKKISELEDSISSCKSRIESYKKEIAEYEKRQPRRDAILGICGKTK